MIVPLNARSIYTMLCISKGIGLAGIRSQAYDRTTHAPYGKEEDDDALSTGSGWTEESEGAMEDDGDDSGSLTSVD